jgi:hypothetical protein
LTQPSDPIEERRKAVDSAGARVESRGATRGERFDRDNEYWVVMADPEGNEFCVQ